MGYDIIGVRNKKDFDVISHVQCLYQWQPKFREALEGHEITSVLNGRITLKNMDEIVSNIDKIIEMIEE